MNMKGFLWMRSMKYQVPLHNRPFIQPFIVHSCEPFMFIHVHSWWTLLSHSCPFMSTLPSHSYPSHPIRSNPTVSFVPIPSHSCQPYRLIRTYSIPFIYSYIHNSYQPYCPIRTYSIPFMQTCTSLHSYSYTFTNYLYYATFVGCHNQFFCIV